MPTQKRKPLPARAQVRTITRGEIYAQNKGYPPLPTWAKSFNPQHIEANKYVIWRGKLRTPEEEALKKVLSQKLPKGQHRYLIFEETQSHSFLSLGTAVIGTPATIGVQARKLFPDKAGRMSLEKIA